MVKNISAEPFIDEVEIHVRGGRGGDGRVHFRREKYVPKGGPDGGDGGKGGDVVFRATTHVNTLNAFRSRRDVAAESGRNGGGGRCTGASGKDTVFDVPVGTLIYDRDQDVLLADLDEDGARFIAAHGGKGGLGNWHFKTSVTQAPRRATPGAEGEAIALKLELRLLADVALIGFPNAGKSSLIRTISRARPKVADYPFTTLIPNLGVVSVPGGDGFVVADIPGLIEGASGGAGLGHQFLRHISRARVLVHVLDLAEGADIDSLLKRHKTITAELADGPVDIAAPLGLLVLNKTDLLAADQRNGIAEDLLEATGIPVFWASTVSGEGIDALVGELSRMLTGVRKAADDEPVEVSAADRIWGAA